LQVFGVVGHEGEQIDQVTRRADGEWEVLGDARVASRFYFVTGITSVVPWLVVSESSHAPTALHALPGLLLSRQRLVPRQRPA
jgi:hypothetical protein